MLICSPPFLPPLSRSVMTRMIELIDAHVGREQVLANVFPVDFLPEDDEFVVGSSGRQRHGPGPFEKGPALKSGVRLQTGLAAPRV
jgi:hypothetical protein